jgi:hypothetical protein
MLMLTLVGLPEGKLAYGRRHAEVERDDAEAERRTWLGLTALLDRGGSGSAAVFRGAVDVVPGVFSTAFVAPVVSLPGRLPRVVRSGDLLRSHRKAGHRRGSARVERVAQQPGHRILGVVFQGPVEGCGRALRAPARGMRLVSG